MLVVEYDGDLQTDLIASSVFELREGLDGDIDGSLDGQSMINEQCQVVKGTASGKEGTYVIVLCWGDVHHP